MEIIKGKVANALTSISKDHVVAVAKDIYNEEAGMYLDEQLTTYSTTTQMNTAITNAVNNLDVASVGGSGKYISTISETNGKISATAATMPTTLPASDVSAWAKASTKPAYTASEVGADPSGSSSTALATAKTYADTKLNDKVDKVTGKSLSSVDGYETEKTTSVDFNYATETYVNNKATSLQNDINTKTEEAPKDGEAYIRKNGKWEIMPNLEEQSSYGIEFDTTVSSPTCTRIGNMTLHRTLPVQSMMRGCLLDDNGMLIQYLSDSDWQNDSIKDGSVGQVMIELPDFYWKFETEGTKRRVKMSTIPLGGYTHVKKQYVSAYEATVDRTTNTLASVLNLDVKYRGGNNNSSWDGTYKTLLGKCATVISRTNFRTYARKRKPSTSEWNCNTYSIQKELYWLFVVEYATLNSQATFNSQLTTDGYRQGGLGAGISNTSDWGNFNGYYPYVPIGHTDSLGNGTGQVLYTASNDDSTIKQNVYANRYRGVENPFGHTWKWTDGINVRINPTEANGGNDLSEVFVCSEPSNFTDTTYDGYHCIGNEARTEGYVKSVIFGDEGDIMPEAVGGGSTTYHCDYHYTNIPTTVTLRGVLFGGSASYGSYCGFSFAYSNYVPSYTHTIIGSRLCFIPE